MKEIVEDRSKSRYKEGTDPEQSPQLSVTKGWAVGNTHDKRIVPRHPKSTCEDIHGRREEGSLAGPDVVGSLQDNVPKCSVPDSSIWIVHHANTNKAVQKIYLFAKYFGIDGEKDRG